MSTPVRSSFVVSIALVMGLMLSPDSLIILGNSMGVAGVSFLAAILLAVIAHVSTASTYGRLFALFPGPGGEAQFTKEALGTIPAIGFPLCSRAVFTVCASTGMLVTAGFVFNEVFLYWFPNFGFAFLLLGFLLVVNLLGHRVSEKFQVAFVMVAMLGLIFLSAAGLIGSSNAPSAVTEVSPGLTFRAGLLGLVLFIGFDLVGFRKSDNDKYPVNPVKPMVVGITLVGVVFCLWGLVSTIYVPLDKLADTTIPYTVTARKVLGQQGRMIIGLVVIAGTSAAVNALFMAVSRMIVGMVGQGLLPRFLGLAGNRAPIPLVLLAMGTAVMMATGMAGEPALEVYVRAGLLFWLLNYAVVHLSALVMTRRLIDRSQPGYRLGFPVVPIIGLLVTVAGFAGLLWSDDEAALLLKFMLVVLAVVFFFGLVWTGLSGRTSKRFVDS